MSTDLRLQIKSTSSDSSENIGAQIGSMLKGGEVIELASDLGGGKTVLVRGLAKGAGSQDEVGSPTFTISKVYSAPGFSIHHFDFYRLSEPGIVANELQEVIEDKAAVTVIEWGGIVKNVLPEKRLKVQIQVSGDNERLLNIAYPKDLAYLVEGLIK